MFFRVLLIFLACASRVPCIWLFILRVISKVVWVSFEFLIEAAVIKCSSGLIPIGLLILTSVIVIVAVSSLTFRVSGVTFLTPRGTRILLLVICSRSLIILINLVQRISILLLGLKIRILRPFGVLLLISGVVAIIHWVFAFFPFGIFFLFFTVWILEF